MKVCLACFFVSLGFLSEALARDPFVLVGLVHDDEALNRPHDVEVQGGLAFVAGKGGSLAILDVSDVTRPRVLSALVGLEQLEDAETVLPMGNVVPVGSRDFLAVDVSDARRPMVVKRISNRPRIDRINGMALRGQIVFTANKVGSVGVFDVSNPSDPNLVDVLDTRIRGGLRSPHDIAVFGDRILVANAAHHGPVFVQVYRVADPKTHALLPTDKWEIEGSIVATGKLHEHLGGANRIAIAGRYAGVGAFVRDRVGIIDIRNPKRLKLLATMPVADIGANGMAAAGRILFVAGGEAVEAIDLSDPARPVSIAQYRNGRLFPTRRLMLGKMPRFDNAHDLVYREGYLFVTAQNDNQLGILKVNDRRVLELAGQPMVGTRRNSRQSMICSGGVTMPRLAVAATFRKHRRWRCTSKMLVRQRYGHRDRK
ncbi:MAG TPA: hypothetical protein EYP14_18565 [Planctomycetaceae bacterium]|nr:hypothetical protein [Planctomycetaceae bacterium]